MNSHTGYPKSGKISQVKGTILHKTGLISNTRCKFGSARTTFTLTSWLQMQGFHFPLRSDNSPERLTQLSKVLYLWLQFCYWKDRNQNQTKERCIVWEGSKNKAFIDPRDTLPTWHTNIWCYTEYCQPGKLTPTSVSRDFIWVSLCRHNWLNYLPLGWTQSLAPDSCPDRSGR